MEPSRALQRHPCGTLWLSVCCLFPSDRVGLLQGVRLLGTIFGEENAVLIRNQRPRSREEGAWEVPRFAPGGGFPLEESLSDSSRMWLSPCSVSGLWLVASLPNWSATISLVAFSPGVWQEAAPGRPTGLLAGFDRSRIGRPDRCQCPPGGWLCSYVPVGEMSCGLLVQRLGHHFVSCAHT